MIKRLPLLFRHVTYNLRGGFLVRPLTITLVLGFAGAFLSEAEEMFPGVSEWVPGRSFRLMQIRKLPRSFSVRSQLQS